MSEKFLWWCYLHTNGHIQAKRYFDLRDLEDADEKSIRSRKISALQSR